jgi:hypothetical protein
MAITTRQTSLLVPEDWTKIIEVSATRFSKVMILKLYVLTINYLQLYYPEDFNDYIESSRIYCC